MTQQKKGLIRTHKAISDYGLTDYYKYYHASHKDTRNDLEKHVYSSLMKDILKGIADAMVDRQYDLKLPFSLGRILVRKYKPSVKFNENGEPYIKRGIDWKKTNELWEDYPELEKKQFVYYTNEHSGEYTFTIIYRKKGCIFRNRLYYTAQLNRDIKRKMARKIFSGEFDALETNTK